MREALPFLTVAIPTYRREKPLCETLRSVLEQQYPRFEIVVVDQSPSHEPETETHLRDLETRKRIRWIRIDRANLPHARNVATAHAQGEVVAFLDDDVLLPPGYLQRCGAHFRDLRLAGVCGLTMEPGDTAGSAPPLWCSEREARDRVDLPLCNYGTPVLNPLHFVGANMAFRRDWILRAGGFNANMAGSALGEDIEFAGRLRRLGARTFYDPQLALWHCRATEGGCRLNAHDAFARSRDRMRNFYYALFHGGGWDVGGRAVLRRWCGLLSRVAGRKIDGPQSAPRLDAPSNGGRAASGAGRLVGALEGIAASVRDRNVSGHYHDAALLKPPHVTIVVPTLGRNEYLSHAVRSLSRTIPREAEILIVDQSRTAWTPPDDLPSFPRIRVIHESRQGASRARNVAAAHAREGILLFVDDDITALPRLVEEHLRHYADSEVWAVGGRILWREEDAGNESPFQGNERKAREDFEAPVCYHTTAFRDALHVITCNFSVRRERLIQAGGFHEWFRGGGEDVEFVARLRRLGGRVAYEPRAAVIHHSARSGGSRFSEAGAFMAAYGKMLAFHFSALRSVGPLGWLGFLVRRLYGQGSRFIRLVSGTEGARCVPVSPTAGPVAEFVNKDDGKGIGVALAVLYKLTRGAGSAAAVVPAWILYIREFGTSGHYFATVRDRAGRRRHR